MGCGFVVLLRSTDRALEARALPRPLSCASIIVRIHSSQSPSYQATGVESLKPCPVFVSSSKSQLLELRRRRIVYNDEYILRVRYNDKLVLLRPQPQQLHLILATRQPQLPLSLPCVAPCSQRGNGKTYLGIQISHEPPRRINPPPH